MAADARWHLQRAYQLPLAGSRAELFFFDTSPFVQKYYETAWANRIGARCSEFRKSVALGGRVRNGALWSLLDLHATCIINTRRAGCQAMVCMQAV